jgi:hypothetical protein
MLPESGDHGPCSVPSLYGTGIRGAATVQARIGGQPATVQLKLLLLNVANFNWMGTQAAAKDKGLKALRRRSLPHPLN